MNTQHGIHDNYHQVQPCAHAQSQSGCAWRTAKQRTLKRTAAQVAQGCTWCMLAIRRGNMCLAAKSSATPACRAAQPLAALLGPLQLRWQLTSRPTPCTCRGARLQKRVDTARLCCLCVIRRLPCQMMQARSAMQAQGTCHKLLSATFMQNERTHPPQLSLTKASFSARAMA